MANEISVTVQISVTNGEYVSSRIGQSDTLNQTTAGFGNPGTVTIGTTAEQVTFGDIAPGFVYLKNCDSTNFVTYGGSSGALPFKIPATSQELIGMASGGELWMLANAAACKVIVFGVNA